MNGTAGAIVRGYSDGDTDTNPMLRRSLESLAEERYSRRQTMLGSLQATAVAFLGTGVLSACDLDLSGGDNPVVGAGANATVGAGRNVTLTGTVSSTSTTTATWRQVSGPPVTLAADGNNATFVAPGVAAPTDLVFAFDVVEGDGDTASATTTVTVTPATLAFDAVAKNRLDLVTVPTGYSVTVMTRVGDPIAAGVSAYANDGTDANFAQRIGDHGDALYFYGLSGSGTRDDNSSTRGLMVQNHENLNVQYLHPNGPTNVSTGPRPAEEAIKEIDAHGVSVTEYRDAGNRQWSYVQDSPFNRRITPNTPTVFHGPARGSELLRTVYSTDGTQGRGTINNCANGHTLWGTNLTCEENWAGYFKRPNSGATSDNGRRSLRELTALRRYGVTSTNGNYAWSSVASTDPVFQKWDARATGDSA
ncbi:MAG: DUF839 domain-containing protein, partial [Porphyrobacter sp.]|nr:DUF839 domain-containing protein [Porphyrobacter sp.]